MNEEKFLSSKKILVANPISTSTRLIKRNLLFFSSVTIIGITYGPGSITLPMTNLPSNTLLGALGCIVIYHIFSYSISFVTDVQGWHISLRNLLEEKQLKALCFLSERMAEIDNEFRRIHSHLSSHKRVYREQTDKLTKEIIEHLDKNNSSTSPDKIINDLLGFSESSLLFKPENFEILNKFHGHYQREVKKVTRILIDFHADAKRYRKLERLIKRELTQFRIAQYFQIYIWSFAIPVGIGIFAIQMDASLIFAFFGSIFN